MPLSRGSFGNGQNQDLLDPTTGIYDICNISIDCDNGKNCQVLNLSNFKLIPLDITDFVILCILNIFELQQYLLF